MSAWAPSTAYVVGPPASAVRYNGAVYTCITPHTSGSSFDASKFALFVPAGATIYETTGAPSSSVGNDGDLAFDSAAAVFYRKASGAWGVVANLATAAAASALAAQQTADRAAFRALFAQTKGDLQIIAAMPAGAIGIWLGDEYVATTRKVIPNVVATTLPSESLITAPRRLFGNGEHWVNSGCTITDGNAAGWDGVAGQASTVVMAAGGFLRPRGFEGNSADVLAAGRYTLARTVRRAAAASSNQSFRGTEFSTSVHSANCTATTTMQRFNWCFDWAGGPIHLLAFDTIDGSTAAQLEVQDCCLFSTPGAALGTTTTAVTAAADPGALDVPAGHLFIGRSNTDPLPTVTGGVFDQSSGGFGLIQFDKAQALTAFSVIAITQKTAENNGFGPLLSKVQSYTDLTISYEYAEGVYAQAANGAHQHLFSPATDLNRWQAYHEVYDGAKDAVGINGVPLESYSLTGTRTVADLWSGLVASITGKAKLAAMAVYPRALSTAELRSAIAQFTARTAKSGVTLSARKFYIAEGHSIPFGSVLSPNSLAYTYQQGLYASPQINGVNYAEAGDQMVHIEGRLTKLLPVIQAAVAAGYRPIVSVMMGRNDFSAGTSPAAFCADYSVNYLDVLRAAGAYVILETVLPAVNVGFTTWRHTVNTTMRGWVGAYGVSGKYCDAIMDWDTVSGIGGDADAGTVDSVSSPTGYGPAFGNYLDGTHPNATGNGVMRPYLTAKIDAAPAT